MLSNGWKHVLNNPIGVAEVIRPRAFCVDHAWKLWNNPVECGLGLWNNLIGVVMLTAPLLGADRWWWYGQVESVHPWGR
jgi:hypothetical protein